MQKATFKDVKSIIEEVQKDIEEVKKLAEKKGFDMLRIESSQEIKKVLGKKYLIVYLANIYISNYWNNKGIEEITKNINKAINEKENLFLKEIRYKCYNSKNKTISLYKQIGIYNFYHIGRISDLKAKDFENVIKEYQNGRIDIQLTENVFNEFVKIADYTNQETKQVLKAITPEIRAEHKERKKESYYNEYHTIWELREKLKIEDTADVNYYLVMKKLS